MPRVAPITGKADVPAEHHAVVDDVLGVFGQVTISGPKAAKGVLTFAGPRVTVRWSR